MQTVGVARDDGQLHIGVDGPKDVPQAGQDGFITCVAKTVVAGEEELTPHSGCSGTTIGLRVGQRQRADVGAVYFQTQQLAALLGQTTRKTAALLAATIEGVAIPKTMKDAWAAGLDTDLSALDAALAALPGDK